MATQNEASAIIAHYLRQLTQAAGMRWTEHNDHDMQRLGELLAGDDRRTITPFYPPAAVPVQPAAAPAPPAAQLTQPAEPPTPAPEARQLDTRVTTVLEQPAGRARASTDDVDDPNYQQWRAQREPRQREAEEALRMLRREARR